MTSITLNTRTLRGIIPITIAFSILMLILTNVVHRIFHAKLIGHDGLLYITGLFNLSAENTIASWFSSMLLLSAGMFALLCHWYCPAESHIKKGFFDHGWILMAILFVAMSLDEMGSIHENLGRLQFLDIFKDGSWQSVITIPLALIMAYMLVFAWKHLRKNFTMLVLLALGCMLFLSIPIHEHFEMRMWAESNYDANWQRPLAFVFLEEGAELFASVCFLSSMIHYLCFMQSQEISVPIRLSAFGMGMGASVAVGLNLLFFNLDQRFTADEGIAVNWFPSAMHFIMFIVLMWNKRANKVTSGTLVLLSIFYATNLYAIMDWDAILLMRIVVSALISTGMILAALSFYKNNGRLTNIMMAGWIMINLSGLFHSSPLLPFWSFLLSLGILITFVIIPLADSNAATKMPPGSKINPFIK